jgi:hypothetical protein
MTEPRSLLGGRYSLGRPVLSSPGEQHWMAIEAVSGRLVVVAIADPGRLSTLEPAQNVRHRHLATVIDVVREVDPGSFPDSVRLPAGAGAAVAEHVPGKTLRAMLEHGPMHPGKAVAWVLRLVDAVQVLHSSGAVHGGISARSVIAEPERRPVAPLLSQLMVPAIGPYCPPERLRGGAESASDDVWALVAVLYTALTAKTPHSGSTREELLKAMLARPAPLSASGIKQPVLEEIILRGLAPERRSRATDLGELQSWLETWERDPTVTLPPRAPARAPARGLGDIAIGAAYGTTRDDGIVIDDGGFVDDRGGTLPPPPAPASFVTDSEPPTVLAQRPLGYAPVLDSRVAAAPPGLVPKPTTPRVQVPAPAQRRVSFNPFERKGSAWPWVLLAAGAGLAAAYALLSSSPKPVADAAPSSAPDVPIPRVAAASAPIKNADVTRDECVAQHFPPDAFEGRPDFAFVCEDAELPAMARRLGSMVLVADAPTQRDGAVGSDAGIAVDVLRLSGVRVPDAGTAFGSGLEWYELPAIAIIRKACCTNSSPVVLAETAGGCEKLQGAVRRMADDSARAMDLSPATRNYDKAVNCLIANRVKHPYAYGGAPSAASRAAFQQFLGRAAIISTKR